MAGFVDLPWVDTSLEMENDKRIRSAFLERTNVGLIVARPWLFVDRDPPFDQIFNGSIRAARVDGINLIILILRYSWHIDPASVEFVPGQQASDRRNARFPVAPCCVSLPARLKSDSPARSPISFSRSANQQSSRL
jgi:hypothetical protein